MKFETAPQEPMEKMGGEEISAPEKELRPEVMEEFRGRRALLFERYATRKTAETAALLTPFIDVPALMAGVVRGKTFAGEQLTPDQRMRRTAIASFLTLAYALGVSGMPAEALAAKGAASAFGAIEFGPETISFIMSAAEKKLPSVVPYLEKLSNLIPDLDPELVSLNLNS